MLNMRKQIKLKNTEKNTGGEPIAEKEPMLMQGNLMPKEKDQNGAKHIEKKTFPINFME